MERDCVTPIPSAITLMVLIALATGFALPSAARAQTPFGAKTFARADASSLTCSELKGTIRKYGAVSVRSLNQAAEGGPSSPVTERYVRHRGFCFFNETTANQTVSTTDTDRCYLKLCIGKERNSRR